MGKKTRAVAFPSTFDESCEGRIMVGLVSSSWSEGGLETIPASRIGGGRCLSTPDSRDAFSTISEKKNGIRLPGSTGKGGVTRRVVWAGGASPSTFLRGDVKNMV